MEDIESGVASNNVATDAVLTNRNDAMSMVGIFQVKDYFADKDGIDLHLPAIERDKIISSNSNSNNKLRSYIGDSLRETYELNRSWVIKVFRFISFYCVGILFYYNVEHWTFLDCVYFITQTISTVGYGNITPITPSGQTFTIFYIYCGILLVFSVINDVASTLVDFFRTKYKKSLKKSRLQIIVRHTLNTLMWSLVLLLVICFGGTVFHLNEGIPFQHALYFAAVTSTTVGYGDFILRKKSSIVFNIVYMLVFVAVTALALQKISQLPQKIENTELRGLLDAIEPSPELIDAIRSSERKQTLPQSEDDSGSSSCSSSGGNDSSRETEDSSTSAAEVAADRMRVSKAEFVLHMLQLAGKIDRNYDMLKWMDRFEEFDVDKDGFLTMGDVQAYAAMKALHRETETEQLYSKSWLRKVAEETTAVVLETLKLQEPKGDEVVTNQAISSPIHERKASATFLTSASQLAGDRDSNRNNSRHSNRYNNSNSNSSSNNGSMSGSNSRHSDRCDLEMATLSPQRTDAAGDSTLSTDAADSNNSNSHSSNSNVQHEEAGSLGRIYQRSSVF